MGVLKCGTAKPPPQTSGLILNKVQGSVSRVQGIGIRGQDS